ncbi:hypothetical protein BKA70DRAFT_1285496 [Coprinopsis sp. MPI-PUGE-AT-0042]|nr:hypothetical protein BKA70DRAFT_1285496 [Coprinopsis sp. MPI-PUGE-AT-0042]
MGPAGEGSPIEDSKKPLGDVTTFKNAEQVIVSGGTQGAAGRDFNIYNTHNYHYYPRRDDIASLDSIGAITELSLLEKESYKKYDARCADQGPSHPRGGPTQLPPLSIPPRPKLPPAPQPFTEQDKEIEKALGNAINGFMTRGRKVLRPHENTSQVEDKVEPVPSSHGQRRGSLSGRWSSSSSSGKAAALIDKRSSEREEQGSPGPSSLQKSHKRSGSGGISSLLRRAQSPETRN